jgi:hypothetical protein
MKMYKIASWLSLSLLGMLFLLLNAAPLQAQFFDTWVSGVGNDSNSCLREAPCQRFTRAVALTLPGGSIHCVDPGIFTGGVTITKSITIDCTGTFAGVSTFGNGIVINALATDTVILRGLDFIGSGGGSIGVNVVSVGTLRIEHCKISRFNALDAVGVLFAIPSGFGSDLAISDSVISNNGIAGTTGGGIVTSAAGTATGRIALDRVKVDNNSAGVRIVSNSGGTGQMSLSMRDSTASGNKAVGVTLLSTGATVVAALDNVAATLNGTGVLADGAATRLLITRVTTVANNVGISTANSGVIVSYGDNHINNNISVNGAPTVTQTPQ